MTKDEVIMKFCSLSAIVAAHLDHRHNTADCFCGRNRDMKGYFYYSEEILAFITKAVEEKMHGK